MGRNSFAWLNILSITAVLFCGCNGMATLFHGEEPEDPPVTYTITYNANTGTGNVPSPQTVNAGTVVYLPDALDLSKSGYVFVGWCASAGGTGTTYTVGYAFTVNADITLYARWFDSNTPQYTVTFNANGAASGSAPAAQTVYSGLSISIPDAGNMEKTYCAFKGWNTTTNGSGTAYNAGESYAVTGNITLYAQWQDDTIPAPDNVNAAADSATQISVSWNAVTGATGYNVYRSNTSSGTFNVVGSNVNSPYADTGLTASTTYYYKVAAIRSGSEGPQSAVDSAKTLGEGVVPEGNTLAEQLAYIAGRADDGTIYDISINSNEYLSPTNISTIGRNVTVNIHSASSSDIKTVYLSSATGHLFSINSNITLNTADIVLQGSTTNNVALIFVGTGGTWNINGGTKITGNYNNKYTDDTGGGILINGGTVTMFDGEISGNKATGSWGCGGGVLIWDSGIFTMHGGLIANNSARNFGGGVAINGASCHFTKTALIAGGTSGVIYGSSAGEGLQNTANYYGGGAVYLNGVGDYPNKTRNATLGGYDEISTSNMAMNWE